MSYISMKVKSVTVTVSFLYSEKKKGKETKLSSSIEENVYMYTLLITTTTKKIEETFQMMEMISVFLFSL